MNIQTQQVLAAVKARGGYFTEEHELDALAHDEATRLAPVLVRCGGGRFIAPAQDVQHFISIIVQDGRDYIRDVSLAAGYQE